MLGPVTQAATTTNAKARSAPKIMEWSRLHMAAYKVPRIVDFTDALPRSGTGKIQWRALQEKEWEGQTKS